MWKDDKGGKIMKSKIEVVRDIRKIIQDTLSKQSDLLTAKLIADYVFTLSEPTLGEEEIENIIYQGNYGVYITFIEAKRIAHALAGKIAKPQENPDGLDYLREHGKKKPVCSCLPLGAVQRIQLEGMKDCPIHGEKKEGKLEYKYNPDGNSPYDEYIDNINKCMDAINKLNGREG
jgi:hypothetical protein